MMLPTSNAHPLLLMDDAGAPNEPSADPPRSDDDQMPTSFSSMLHDSDCFVNTSTNSPNPLYFPEFSTLLFNPLDSSHPFPPDPSPSPSPSNPIPSFLSPKSLLPYLFNNNFDNAFDLAADPTLFPPQESSPPAIFMGFDGINSQFHPASDFPATSRTLPYPEDNHAAAVGGIPNAYSFDGFDGGSVLPHYRSKVLRPLQVLPPVGAPPTLFQKRAASRQSSGLQNLGALSSKSDEGLTSLDDTGGMELGSNRKRSYEDEGDDILNYDSDDPAEKLGEGHADDVGDYSNANSSVTVGDQKGKKKGMPAKNLMAERRRRKKLNDRLYMLRSVVPKISKVCYICPHSSFQF